MDLHSLGGPRFGVRSSGFSFTSNKSSKLYQIFRIFVMNKEFEANAIHNVAANKNAKNIRYIISQV